jgi:hypothetical protein
MQGRVVWLAIVCWTCLFWGCSAVRQPALLDAPQTAGARPEAAAGEASEWLDGLQSLGPEDWPGQRTLRLSYDDGGGDVTLLLVWRIVSPSRYSLLAKDRLGRSWWSLAVDGSRATALELRAKTYCIYEEAVELAALPLGPVEFSVLPQLLLGKLPTHGAVPLEAAVGAPEIRLADQGVREWTARIHWPAAPAHIPQVEGWTLSEGEGPVAWYEKRGELHVVSSRRGGRGLQLRWKLGSLEGLTVQPLDLEVPGDFAPGDCADSGAGS